MPSRSRRFLLLSISVALVLVPVLPAGAAQTESSDLVIITGDKTVDDDLYAAGLRVVIEGVVDGDLVAFASEEVVISGEVTGTVTSVAPTTTITGEVGGSVRATGSVLQVSGSVGGDVVAAVARAGLEPGATVGGDMVVWAWSATVAGVVGGDLAGTQRRLRIEGEVGENVDVTATAVEITGPLEVGGDFRYRSPVPADGMDQVTVGGATVHQTPLPPNIRIRALAVFTRLLAILGLTIAALLVAWTWPERVGLAASRARARPWGAWWRGASIVLLPLALVVAGVVAAALAPGSTALPLIAILVPLGVATLGIALLGALVAGAPTALALGGAVARRLGPYGAIAVGSLILGAIWLIPFVSWLVPVLVVPFGVGAWVLAFRAES